MLCAEITTTLAAWIDFNRDNADILDQAKVHRMVSQNGFVTLRVSKLPDDCASRFTCLTPATIGFTLSTPDFHMVWYSNK